MGKLKTFKTDDVCPKCGFPVMQMFRQLNNGSHDLLIDSAVVKCKIKDEHMHMECCCGHEMVCRPMDWDSRPKPKMVPTPKPKKRTKKKIRKIKKG